MVCDLVEQYIREVPVNQKRGKEAERLLRRDFLSVFGAGPAVQLSRRELLVDPTEAVEASADGDLAALSNPMRVHLCC